MGVGDRPTARIADGLCDKRSKRTQSILPAGALLWAWEADADFGEEAGEQWLLLKPDKFNKQTQYAWRYDGCELTPGGELKPLGQPRSAAARPRVADAGSDEEYLATDDEMMLAHLVLIDFRLANYDTVTFLRIQCAQGPHRDASVTLTPLKPLKTVRRTATRNLQGRALPQSTLRTMCPAPV